MKHLSFYGVPLIEIAKENGLSSSGLYSRIRRGTPQQDAPYKRFETSKKKYIRDFISATRTYNRTKTVTFLFERKDDVIYRYA